MAEPSSSLDLIPLISSVTALAAVLISPFVSWRIASRQLEVAKDEISAAHVSSKRQVWIDELRKDVAEALALVARVEELKRPAEDLSREESLAVFDERMTAQLRAAELLMRIKLRLNPNEQEHKDLVDAFRALGDASPDVKETETREEVRKITRAFISARDDVLTATQVILKTEWNRVRRGE